MVPSLTRFQSTLPLRGVTAAATGSGKLTKFQSTLPLRGVTLSSIFSGSFAKFQSTLSVRRATHPPRMRLACHAISIHALREESDVGAAGIAAGRAEFQSTLSVRRATYWQVAGMETELFQSTLSVRRATSPLIHAFFGDHISIHALREESDLGPPSWRRRRSDFNPRSP